MPTIPERHTLWRIALHLQRQYASRMTAPTTLRTDLEDCWRQFQHRQRQWEWAHQHGLAYAETVCQRQLAAVAHALRQGLETWQNPPVTSLPIRALYEELLSLFAEFPHVAGDLRQKTVSVHTERIELNDIDLGPFEIQLPIGELGSSFRYRVIALKPNPCADDSDTPHPHVHHNGLCEGDGNPAIHRALGEGRLLDFFVLVRQVLRTYNPSSAYRALEAWFDTPCVDCGGSVPDEERCECERCGNGLCGSCASSCASCGQTACAGCVRPCIDCGGHCCDHCQRFCQQCDQLFCEGCLDDGLCPNCLDSPTENPDDVPLSTLTDPSRPSASPPAAVATPSEAAVQPDRLGETPVPA